MAAKIKFGCLPTVIGSMPHINPEEACRLLLRHLHAIPCWPQLPQRSYKENMYVQYSEGFPGISVSTEEEHIAVDRSQDLDPALERLYRDYVEKDARRYAISSDYAAGLHAFLNSRIDAPLAVKGQITGPISWGLSVTDGTYYVVYDETLSEAMAKHLRLKASWQEQALRQKSSNTIIFVDEPYLTSLGSPFVSLPTERVVALLEETLGGIDGLRGLHCCGSADWSMALNLPIDILSFDAYNYPDTLTTYAAEVKTFLERGGTIAWGIIPNEEEAVARETAASLSDRLGEVIAPFTRDGIRFRQIIEQGLITPSCGLASLSLEAADAALTLLAELSAKLRKRYMV
ncbi:MAG: methionine synthase [Chloroflexi bacterium]|nr:methionine synthase [Chloroflexota bacterium]